MAVDLARAHKADVWHANLAALLHDSAKWMDTERLYREVERYGIRLDPIEKLNPSLLHSRVGAELAKEKFKVTEFEVLEAIHSHTTGNLINEPCFASVIRCRFCRTDAHIQGSG